MKKYVLIFAIFIITAACAKKEGGSVSGKENDGGKQAVQTQQQEKTPEEEVREMVVLWNEASSNGDLAALENMLADKVEYYQSTVTRDYYIKDQKKFFEENPVYGQEIKGDIDIQKISSNQYKAEFVKEVTTKKGTRDYPSYLVFKKIGDEWKIVLESDKVSDTNIEKAEEKKKAQQNKSTYYYAENQTLIGRFDIKKIFVEEGAADEVGKTIYPYFLFLNAPVKVVPSTANDAENTVESGVREIQLVLDEDWINFLKKKQAYGKKVKMTGELFHSHTVYHHSAVLMIVKNIEVLD